MSQRYEMNVEIRNFDPSKSKAIQEAANQEWNFEDWYETNTYLQSSSEGYLCGGETDSQFTDSLTETIWKANGAFCQVTLNATYLEDLPCETYQRDEEDYQRFLLGGATPSGEAVEVPIHGLAEPAASNDHVCPSCGNTSVSLTERDQGIPCWKCGGQL